jgi:hypothetical protein
VDIDGTEDSEAIEEETLDCEEDDLEEEQTFVPETI